MSDIKDTFNELEQKQKEIEEKEKELESKKAEIQNYEEQKTALTQEKERLLSDIEKARAEKREAEKKEVSFQEKFKNEQLEKAKTKFFQEFGYTEKEKQDAVLGQYTSLNSQSVDAENIYNELVKIHVSNNAGRYIEFERKAIKFAGSADKFLESSSASAFAGSGASEIEQQVELTEDDIMAAQWSGTPLETMRKLKKEGKV